MKFKWKHLPFDKSKPLEQRRLALRLNSLADPYFFSKVVLKQSRLVEHLHGVWLNRLSDPNLHVVFEAPRDHFKSTCGTLTLPMWWALPFESKEEDWMHELGYADEWIRYMKRIHSRDLRILIAFETEPNAINMGNQYDNQYQNNKLFREIFSDLIPPPGSTWNTTLKRHNCTRTSGEATFNFVGVGTVLQSRHLDRAVQDDLFGEKALYSPSTAQQTIEWHQRLPGAFDTDRDSEDLMNLELVIGNRWGLNDLNGWIRKNNPLFKFETHSAEGGCCTRHPPGQPIFPEEFTMERLKHLRVRFGTRSYAAHYLNVPISEDECTFRKSWLKRFRTYMKEFGIQQDGKPLRKTFIEIIAESSDDIAEDFAASELKRILILDPNHGGDKGKARHAAIVVGWRKSKGQNQVFLLESWARAVSHEQMAGHVMKMAERWHVDKFYVETIAGQDGWLLYFERQLKDQLPWIVVESLPKERGAGAKERRIHSMSQMYERGQVLVRKVGGGVEDFLAEYELHPNGTTVDLIDCMGYLFNIIEQQVPDMGRWKYNMERDMERRRRSVGQAGY